MRLRGAGCSNAPIGAITGPRTRRSTRILEKHYAADDPVPALQAIKKLAAYYAAEVNAGISPKDG